jgi:hypothetical protein
MKRMFLGKLLALLILAAVLSGCGGTDGSKGKLAPVTGRVLFKSEGVTAGEIYFLPDEAKGTQGSMASSVLQEDGSFTLTTYGVGDGVRPGSYKATIVLGRRPEKELAKFRSIKTTPLEYEVTENGLTGLEINLDDPPEKDEDKK